MSLLQFSLSDHRKSKGQSFDSFVCLVIVKKLTIKYLSIMVSDRALIVSNLKFRGFEMLEQAELVQFMFGCDP